ncbi:hypothetical protein [Clostridium beijerinckii]|nr:hypothetical protein [Clostridium beijerinckii]
MTIEKAEEILKARGIKKEDLSRVLKENALEIGMFTMPFPKSIEQESNN